MFRPIFLLQWKVSRWAVLILLPLCFGLPILVMRFAARVSQGRFSEPAIDMIRMVAVWATLFPFVAAITGVTFALCAWTWDHETNHVYALSLPVERWRYALLKMGAGAASLAIPVAAVLIGAIIAVSTTRLPEGVHSYAISFGFRFLLAAALCYATTFALASGTIKTTVRIFFGLFVILVFGTLLTGFIETAFELQMASPFELLERAVMLWPGPLSVFGGNWMLIDV